MCPPESSPVTIDAHAAEEAHAEDDHAVETADGGEHHYDLVGAPGEGAIHAAPGNTVLNDAHSVPAWVKVAPFFAMLDKLARDNGLEGRSMGMSGDYEIAIEFGATHVRVGTAIFGDRLKPAG